MLLKIHFPHLLHVYNVRQRSWWLFLTPGLTRRPARPLLVSFLILSGVGRYRARARYAPVRLPSKDLFIRAQCSQTVRPAPTLHTDGNESLLPLRIAKVFIKSAVFCEFSFHGNFPWLMRKSEILCCIGVDDTGGLVGGS